MKLYRLVSEEEYQDVLVREGFFVARNTLEAKEFWLSEIAARRFLADMRRTAFKPPYTRLAIVDVDAELHEVSHWRMALDGHDALVVDRDGLALFNSIITYTVVDL